MPDIRYYRPISDMFEQLCDKVGNAACNERFQETRMFTKLKLCAAQSDG